MLSWSYMGPRIQDAASAFLILSVFILSGISILGVWQVFDTDVIFKSFQTLALLAVVAVAVLGAGRYLDKGNTTDTSPMVAVFKSLRHIILGVLIVSAALLAFLGILAIWEVIQDSQVVMRAISSLGIIGFASLITVAVCLEREKRQVPGIGNSSSFIGFLVFLGFLMFLYMGMWW